MAEGDGSELDILDPEKLNQGFRFFKMLTDAWRASGFGRSTNGELADSGESTIEDYKSQLMQARIEGQRQSNELDKKVAEAEMQALELSAMAAINTRTGADPKELRSDWVRYYANSAAIASTDVDIKYAFAKLLAGETNRLGSYSRLAIDILAKMETRHAKTLQALRSFSVLHLRTAAQIMAMYPDAPRVFVPLIFELNAPIYMKHNMTYDALTELQALGLLSVGVAVNSMTGPTRFVFAYPSSHLIVTPKSNDSGLQSGHVLPSFAGNELLNLCAADSIDGFVDYVSQHWRSQGHEVSHNLNDVLTVSAQTSTGNDSSD